MVWKLDRELKNVVTGKRAAEAGTRAAWGAWDNSGIHSAASHCNMRCNRAWQSCVKARQLLYFEHTSHWI